MDAYVRVPALVAAIVRFVRRRDRARSKISAFLTGARKKSLEGIPRVLGYDWRHGEQKMALEVSLKQPHVTLMALVAMMAWCIVGLGGCQATTEREEIIGRWRLKAESRVFLEKNLAHLNPSIEMKKDGTFIAVDLPQSSFLVDGKWQEFVMRGEGVWQLDQHQKRPVIHLQFSRLENYMRGPYQSKDSSGFGSYLYIEHTGSELYLFYHDNDPDMGREIRFQKESIVK